MSNPWAACSLVEGFVPPSLGFRCSRISYVLTTYPYLDKLEVDIFGAGGLQRQFITFVATYHCSQGSNAFTTLV